MKSIDKALSASKNEFQILYERLILNIMKLRNNSGLTQNQLAKKTNISHTTIARIENFSMQPTLLMTMKILDNYGMTLEIKSKNDMAFEELYNRIEEINKASTSVPSELKEEEFNILLNELFESIRTSINYENEYSLSIDSILDNYLTLLEKHSINESVTSKVRRFNKYIKIILEEYCFGQHNLAYELFKEMIRSCINIECFIKDLNNETIMYRARKKKKKNYSKDELFHIPLDKRYKVSTERYSYPGLPCLYLGSSKEVCAEELSHDESELVFAKIIYNARQKNKVFDLTSIFFDVLTNHSCETCENFLVNYPLVIACSTYIDYENKDDVKFKEEYILPQLLLEFIINESILENEKVLGIKYFSVKKDYLNSFIKGNIQELTNICNYVFPCRSIKEKEGVCKELKSYFDIVKIS